MARSQRVKVSDVAAVFELVYECCELGADPTAWREHLLHGMNRLLGGDVSFGGRADWGNCVDREVTLEQIYEVFSDVGWPCESDRRVYLDWLIDGLPVDNPMCQAMVDRKLTYVVARRHELVNDRDWDRAPLIDLYRHRAHIDEAMVANEMVGPGQFLLLVAQRSTGRRGFNDRERHLLAILHGEIRRQLDRRLKFAGEPGVYELSPRLREILVCLLEGDSEKQIAFKLKVSPHTVHSHVKRLHKHFAVASRGELLSRCFPLYPVLRKLNDQDPFASNP